MHIHYGTDNLRIDKPIVTMGSFDGVHKGHVKVIGGLKACARKWQGESVIITFDPHPREVLYPNEKRPGILTTLAEKAEILAAYGVQHLIVIPFNRELAALSYDDFVRHILVDKIGIKGLVVGYDHRFGKNREGNFDVLKGLAETCHFHIEQEEALMANEVHVSSTKIRTALELGDIALVNDFLGYAYSISGEVVHGDKIGRTIGFPTANLKVDDERKLLPAAGVYAVKVSFQDKEYEGMLNVGIRPTVSNSGIVRLETYVFGFDGDLYGEKMTVSLIRRVRGERKFDTLQELSAQLSRDKETVKMIFSNGF
ncbi:MAG: bifunctional riboflavin kinase/FAD synthetase [Oscillibacter sp.]|nr:bifunctional riboflavin kinase/FAD synthetase [Oscillibacter sp.]